MIQPRFDVGVILPAFRVDNTDIENNIVLKFDICDKMNDGLMESPFIIIYNQQDVYIGMFRPVVSGFGAEQGGILNPVAISGTGPCNEFSNRFFFIRQ